MLSMSNTLKNLLIILVLLTIGYGAYYLYTARQSTAESPGVTDAEFQTMLSRTETFIGYRQELDQMQLDLGIFADPRFQNLQSYTRPLDGVESGRDNPFAELQNN